ncbi:MAG: radical SAM/SPASM domain-containing protein [Candidatus Rokuibacteriota bacterium]
MNVIRREVRAERGRRTTNRQPDGRGFYSRDFMVEPTTVCNLKCPLCPVPSHLHRPASHMPMHTYRDVIDDLAGYAESIDLWNFGEPFLNPEIFNMIKYAEDRGIRVRVSTNSTRLGEEDVAEVFRSELSSIIVCLDGASKETHERYRIGSEYEKVVEGISRLARRKRALARSRPFIRLQFLVFRYNEHEIDAIVELAEGIGVDQLALKNVSLGTWVREHLRQKMARKLLPTNDKYRKYTLGEDTVELKIRDRVCSWAYENGIVLANGDVTTCCYDSGGKHVFANVHRDGGLTQILTGDKMKEIRQQIVTRELPLCQTCQYSDYGATLVNFEYR